MDIHGIASRRLVVFLATLGIVALNAISTRAQEAAKVVAQGTDYLQTSSETAERTFIDFSRFSDLGFGVVYLQGKPNVKGACCISVVIQRQTNAGINIDDGVIRPTYSTPLQIVDLSLQTDPKKPAKNKNGFKYSVTVTLDPTQLPQDIGVMLIEGDKQLNKGGTFSSSLAIYFMASFTAVDGGPSIGPVEGRRNLGTVWGSPMWKSEPQEGQYLLQGSYPDQRANQHKDLPYLYVDFFNKGSYAFKEKFMELYVVGAPEKPPTE